MGAVVRGVEGAGCVGGEMRLRGAAFWWAVPLKYFGLNMGRVDNQHKRHLHSECLLM